MKLNQWYTKLAELDQSSGQLKFYFSNSQSLLDDLGSDPEDHEAFEELQAVMRDTRRNFAAVKAETLVVQARIAELSSEFHHHGQGTSQPKVSDLPSNPKSFLPIRI